MAEVKLSELGEGIEKATVACWHFNIGDKVNVGDDVVELVTDKASFNISADSSGIIKEIKFQEGQDAKIGETLAIIEA